MAARLDNSTTHDQFHDGASFLYVELDMPPPVNNLFINVPGRGRIKSQQYRDWTEAAGWQLKAQIGGKMIPGPIGVTIKLVKQSKRKTDLDGRLKAPLDLLCQHGVIEDDSLIQRIEAQWVTRGAPCQITVVSAQEALL